MANTAGLFADPTAEIETITANLKKQIEELKNATELLTKIIELQIKPYYQRNSSQFCLHCDTVVLTVNTKLKKLTKGFSDNLSKRSQVFLSYFLPLL